LRLAVLSALPLLTAAAAGAQSQPSSSPSTIVVRGHWAITVREPDGGLEKKYEFDNALVDARPLLLTISRQQSIAHWNVVLGDVYTVGEPCIGGTPPGERSCILQEPGDSRSFSDAPRLAVLSVGLEGSPSPNKIVLQGTFTAPATGQISQVRTGVAVCANTIAPATPCDVSSAYSFTSHTMQPAGAPEAGGPIPVSAGQVVQVRVEISFTQAPTS
jgi:hypothetical protein